MHVDLLQRTRDLIAECACDNGCPSCVGPVGQTGPLAKSVALRILDHLSQQQLRDVTSPRASVPVAAIAGAVQTNTSDDVPF
jgi:ATP-dependent helicase YprA (DUF1998 family)